MLATFALLLTLSQAPDAGTAVACKTVADCWLDDEGRAMARPKAQKGKKIPLGDCRGKKVWLRHVLTCEQNVCISTYRGDQC